MTGTWAEEVGDLIGRRKNRSFVDGIRTLILLGRPFHEVVAEVADADGVLSLAEHLPSRLEMADQDAIAWDLVHALWQETAAEADDPPTDPERVRAALSGLASTGVAVGLGVGRTVSDGVAEVGGDHRGFVFCTETDAEVLTGRDDVSLYLRFGGTDDDVDLGHRLVAALAEQGLETAWSGTAAAAVVLVGLRWRPHPGPAPRRPDFGEAVVVRPPTPKQLADRCHQWLRDDVDAPAGQVTAVVEALSGALPPSRRMAWAQQLAKDPRPTHRAALMMYGRPFFRPVHEELVADPSPRVARAARHQLELSDREPGWRGAPLAGWRAETAHVGRVRGLDTLMAVACRPDGVLAVADSAHHVALLDDGGQVTELLPLAARHPAAIRWDGEGFVEDEPPTVAGWTEQVLCAAVHPHQDVAAVVRATSLWAPGLLVFLRPSTGDVLHAQPVHGWRSLAFSADGRWLYACDLSNVHRVELPTGLGVLPPLPAWVPTTTAPPGELEVPSPLPPVGGPAHGMDADEQVLVGGGAVWRLRASRDGWVLRLAADLDDPGSEIAAGTGEAGLRAVSSGGAVVGEGAGARVVARDGTVTAVEVPRGPCAISPDGALVAVVGVDVGVLRVEDGVVVWSSGVPPQGSLLRGGTAAVGFDPAGEHLLVAGLAPATATWFRLSDGAELDSFSCPLHPRSVDVTADHVVVCSAGHPLLVHPRRADVTGWTLPGSWSSVAASADGGTLFVAGEEAVLVDLRHGSVRPLPTVRGRWRAALAGSVVATSETWVDVDAAAPPPGLLRDLAEMERGRPRPHVWLRAITSDDPATFAAACRWVCETTVKRWGQPDPEPPGAPEAAPPWADRVGPDGRLVRLLKDGATWLGTVEGTTFRIETCEPGGVPQTTTEEDLPDAAAAGRRLAKAAYLRRRAGWTDDPDARESFNEKGVRL